LSVTASVISVAEQLLWCVIYDSVAGCVYVFVFTLTMFIILVFIII